MGTLEERRERYEKRREILKNELLGMKKEGFTVYMNKPDEFKQYNYGFISDGISVMYVEMDEYETLFVPYFQWKPSSSNGTGCAVLEKGYGYAKLDRDAFDETVKTGKCNAKRWHAVLYKDMDEWIKIRRVDESYIRL